jgi:DNA mismatch repair protein MutL
MGTLQIEEGKAKDGLEAVMRMHEEILARSLSRMTAKVQKIVHDEKNAIILLGDLLKCELPYATPSGRPTMIQFSAVELERKFRC